MKGYGKELQSKVRFGYCFIYILISALFFCVPFRAALRGADGLVLTAFGFMGVGLLAWDLFTQRRFLKIQNRGLLLIFYGICALGVAVNFRYAFVSNIKGLMWMVIMTFLLCAVDEEKPLKRLHLLADLFVAIWTVPLLWSLGQYVLQYSGEHPLPLDGETVQKIMGFYGGRLFGVFIDPNYGAVCSLVAIGLAVMNCKCAGRNRLCKVLYGISVVFNFFYVVLSGSRTAWIAALAAVAFAAGFLTATWLCKRTIWIRAGAGLLAILLSVGISWGALKLTQTGLSYVPGLFVCQEAENNDDPHKKPGDKKPVKLEREDLESGENFSNNRNYIWGACLELVKEKPLLGTTYRGYMDVAREVIPDSLLVKHGYSVHNGYLALLVFTGIFGFAAMMLWCILQVVAIFRYLIRNWTHRDAYYWPIFICTCILLVIAVSAFPLQSVFFSFQIPDLLFWVLMGYTLCMLRRSEPDRVKVSRVEKLATRLFACPFKKGEKE